jgi:hypothetical protein
MPGDNGASLSRLLRLCQIDSGPVDQELLNAADAEWTATLQCAAKHGLTGLLYRRAVGLSHIPVSALLPIQSAARTQTARNCYLASELVEILAALRHRGIESLAIKGPTLVMRAYGHLADRDFCDLDILVHPSDFESACLVLHERGYRAEPQATSQRELEPMNHEIFVRCEDGVTVELHWQLTADLQCIRMPLAGLWSRAQTVLVLDRLIPTLGIEDTLLFLCLHGSKHRWYRLKWLADIAYLMRSEEHVDWRALVSRAQEMDCRRLLIVGICLAANVFACPIPPPIQAAASADPLTLKLVEEMRSSVIAGCPRTSVQWTVHHLQMHERFRDRAVLSCEFLARIWRLTPQDRLPPNYTGRDLLVAALKRPARLYRDYGLQWTKPLLGLGSLKH